MFLAYRNKSISFQWKSGGLLVYDGNIFIILVNTASSKDLLNKISKVFFQ